MTTGEKKALFSFNLSAENKTSPSQFLAYVQDDIVSMAVAIHNAASTDRCPLRHLAARDLVPSLHIHACHLKMPYK